MSVFAYASLFSHIQNVGFLMTPLMYVLLFLVENSRTDKVSISTFQDTVFQNFSIKSNAVCAH